MPATTETYRVVFTFDAGSYKLLETMTGELKFDSNAETMREAMRLLRAIHSQWKNGYSNVIVENPVTGESREIIVDFLERLATEESNG